MKASGLFRIPSENFKTLIFHARRQSKGSGRIAGFQRIDDFRK